VFTIKPVTKILAWIVAAVLVYLNLKMVATAAVSFMEGPHGLVPKMLVVLGLLLLIFLLATVSGLPLWKKWRKNKTPATVHHKAGLFDQLSVPEFRKVAVALDFSGHDEKLIAYALGQGKASAQYILMHVVESASAGLLGDSSDDLESQQDSRQLELYAGQLSDMGYSVHTRLGYRHRVNEIVRMVKEENADLLVMGAHGHTGIKDLIYGETINKVRHELKIPVLVVNL